jgi:hypothetical protein
MSSETSTDTLDSIISSLAVESANASQIFAILVPYSPGRITSTQIVIHVDVISPTRISDVYATKRHCLAELSPPGKKELCVTVPLIRISTDFTAKCFNDEWSLFICRWPTDDEHNTPKSLSVLGSMHFRGLMMSIGAHHWRGHHITDVTWFRLDAQDLVEYSAHQHGVLCCNAAFPACKITTVAVGETQDYSRTHTQVGKFCMTFEDAQQYLGSSFGHGDGSAAPVQSAPHASDRTPSRPYIALTATYARLREDVVANLHQQSHAQLATETSTASAVRRT